MKRFFFLSLCVFAVACSSKTKEPTLEEKANDLMKQAVQKTLLFPDSYSLADTQIDSAFTPFHDPAFVETVFKLYGMANEMEDLDRKMKNAKSDMSFYSSYSSSFYREQYKEAKEKYEKAQAGIDSINKKLKSMGEGFRKQLYGPKVFIGYRAHHSFRAQNNAGQTIMSGAYFLFDKDVTKIVAQWSEDDINIYNEFLNGLMESVDRQELN